MQTKISGTHAMLCAFFDTNCAVLRAPFLRQIDAAVAVGASGVALLGLRLASSTDRILAETPTSLGLTRLRRLAHDLRPCQPNPTGEPL